MRHPLFLSGPFIAFSDERDDEQDGEPGDGERDDDDAQGDVQDGVRGDAGPS